jgi:hypothetical protein
MWHDRKLNLQAPEVFADLMCLECGTVVDNTCTCPSCGSEVRHIYCTSCGTPLMIKDKSGYGNICNNHILIEWTEGGTPTKAMCPVLVNKKLEEWGGE